MSTGAGLISRRASMHAQILVTSSQGLRLAIRHCGVLLREGRRSAGPRPHFTRTVRRARSGGLSRRLVDIFRLQRGVWNFLSANTRQFAVSPGSIWNYCPPDGTAPNAFSPRSSGPTIWNFLSARHSRGCEADHPGESWSDRPHGPSPPALSPREQRRQGSRNARCRGWRSWCPLRGVIPSPSRRCRPLPPWRRSGSCRRG